MLIFLLGCEATVKYHSPLFCGDQLVSSACIRNIANKCVINDIIIVTKRTTIGHLKFSFLNVSFVSNTCLSGLVQSCNVSPHYRLHPFLHVTQQHHANRNLRENVRTPSTSQGQTKRLQVKPLRNRSDEKRTSGLLQHTQLHNNVCLRLSFR